MLVMPNVTIAKRGWDLFSRSTPQIVPAVAPALKAMSAAGCDANGLRIGVPSRTELEWSARIVACASGACKTPYETHNPTSKAERRAGLGLGLGR
jgi:hypothetical protein